MTLTTYTYAAINLLYRHKMILIHLQRFTYIEIEPDLIGLSLSYSLILLGNLQWSIRQSVELENQVLT